MIVFIHRKDLRITDLPAFEYLSKQSKPTLHVLILDPALLKKDRHLAHSGIHFLSMVKHLQHQYELAQQHLNVVFGDPIEVLARLHASVAIEEVVFHQDVSPYAIHRDRAILKWTEEQGVRLTTFADQMLSDPDAFEQFAGRSEPYRVYTPFWNKWRDMMRMYAPAPYHTDLRSLPTTVAPQSWLDQYTIPTDLMQQAEQVSTAKTIDPKQELQEFITRRLDDYAGARDDFAQNRTSGISRYLNLGVLSAREVWAALPNSAASETWRRQLAWREFYLYQAIRDPHFFNYEKKLDFSLLTDQHFTAWANGQTGIPIIDAAMRELNETGYMHNRLRMVTAMFLTKNLLCPFHYGETYFRYKLTDYENTLNRGGWLWSSSIGFDAAPYFRIMSPVLQSQRFNPSGDYIRKWLPELAHLSDKAIHLPQANAIVDLKATREQAIKVYGELLKK